jgi:hypothetical protein
VDKAQTKMD